MEENFIPWSMIEPLLEECVNANALARRILARVGLDVGRYHVITMPNTSNLPVIEAIRHGVRVVTAEVAGRECGPDRGHEPVR